MTDAPKKAITKKRETCNCNSLGWLAMKLVRDPLIVKLQAENEKLKEDNKLLDQRFDDQESEACQFMTDRSDLNFQIEGLRLRLRVSEERRQEWYQKYISEMDRSIGRSTV